MTEIPEEHLDFIDRLLFYEFDEAYRKHCDNDAPPYHDEVLAFERALDTMAEIRAAVEVDEDRIRRTGELVQAEFHDP